MSPELKDAIYMAVTEMLLSLNQLPQPQQNNLRAACTALRDITQKELNNVPGN